MTHESTQQSNRVNTPLNVYQRIQYAQMNHQPSMTIPDQTMTMRQLIERYATGQTLDGGKESIFEEEPTNGINPKTLDLVDIQMLKEENKQRIKFLQKQHDDEQEAKEALSKLKLEVPPIPLILT